MGSQRACMLCFPPCQTQECKAFSLISDINHLRIFLPASFNVGWCCGDEIITTGNILISPQIHSQFNQACFFFLNIIYCSDIEFHKCRRHERKRTSGWNARKEAQRRCKKWGRAKRKKERGDNKMLPCVFWRLSFCLKWKFRVFEGLQWIGRPMGSQAVICTPVIWRMVIMALCVCVCVLYYEVVSGNSNKHPIWSINNNNNNRRKAF